jgi:hypothetical protein
MTHSAFSVLPVLSLNVYALPSVIEGGCELMGIPLVSGVYPSNFIRFSIAGIPQSDQLTVRLDGKDIGWVVEEGIGKDRYFYEYLDIEEGGFENGEHEIQFVLDYDDPDWIAESNGPQLCSVEVLEYGSPHGYVLTEPRP